MASQAMRRQPMPRLATHTHRVLPVPRPIPAAAPQHSRAPAVSAEPLRRALVLVRASKQGYEPANTATARNQQSFFTPEMQQWLLDHATPLIDPGTGAMPRGGWPQIQAGFLDKFGVDKTTKALKSQYYILLRQGDKRTFTAGEVQAILDGVNKVLASEGKPAVKSLTTLTLMDVLRGRKMPDGSPLSLDYKDKARLLADCVEVLGIDLSSAAASDTDSSSGSDQDSESDDTGSGQTPFYWFHKQVMQRTDPIRGGLPRGSWNVFTELYNEKYGTMKNRDTMKTWYYTRLKKQQAAE